VKQLHHQGPLANPLGDDFNYAKAFNKIDFAALKKDITTCLQRRSIGGAPTMVTMAHK
jgi:catalase-peroxidase